MSTKVMKYNPNNCHFTGTTCATADLTSAKKPILPEEWRGCKLITPIVNGSKVYMYGGVMSSWLRAGVNAPVAEVNFEAHQPTAPKIIMLSTNKWIIQFVDANDTKLKVVCVTKSGQTLTAATAVVINNAATDEHDIKRVDADTFFSLYIDEGGSDYLCIKPSTVSGAVVTAGTEVELTAAAVVKDAGGGVALAVDTAQSTIAAFYQLNSDTKVYVLPGTYDSDFAVTAGTAVEVDAGAGIVQSADNIAVGRVVVAYLAVSTSYLTTVVCTISSAGVAVAGTAEEHTTAAASSAEIHFAQEGRGILSWIDSGDPHMVAFDIGTSGTTLNEGADATNAGTFLTASSSLFSPTAGLIVAEEHGTTHYAQAFTFTIAWAAYGSGGVTTLSSTAENLTEAQTDATVVCANDNNEFLVAYNDVAASNIGNMKYGAYYDDARVIDVRSADTSAAYSLLLIPTRDEVQTTAV